MTSMFTSGSVARPAPLLRTLVAVASAAAIGACGDPTGLEATTPTVETTLTVYALTGTQNGANTAISLPRNRAVKADASLVYDVAFDIDDQGRAILYQMRLIAWDRLDVHQVGIQEVPGPFSSVTRAREGGYVYDEPLVGEVGDVFIIQSFDLQGCSFPFPPSMYAKIVIEEIDVAERAVRLRMTLNPNCGFRSFLEGIPRD